MMNFLQLFLTIVIFTQSLEATIAKIVLLSNVPGKKELHVLLTKGEDGKWHPFSKTGRGKANQIVKSVLNEKIGKNYSLVDITWLENPKGTFWHFLKIPYSVEKSFSQEIDWVPVSKILKGDVIDSEVSNIFATHWKSGKNIHSKLQMKKLTDQNAQTVIPQKSTIEKPNSMCQWMKDESWFGISNAVYFYHSKEPFYEFTNTVQGFPIRLEGEEWPTTEQYFQAQKFVQCSNHPHSKKFKQEIQSWNEGIGQLQKAFRAGGKYHGTYDKKCWNKKSLKVMYQAVKAKFFQYKQLSELLKNTGERVIVENAGINDNFYGAGADGSGCNYLGKILMIVRDELQEKEIPKNVYQLPPSYYEKKSKAKSKIRDY